MRIIETDRDVADGLRAIVRRDPRLKPIVAAAGTIPLRRRVAGYEGLARIVVGQQLSIASADAIWTRFAGKFPHFDPVRISRARDPTMKAIGLSGAKTRTLRAIAAAQRNGLDFAALARMPGEEAHARLTEIHGVGPWTADIYLLFCLGHADVFPAGDLALKSAVAAGLSLPARPGTEELAEMATIWSPWRGVAARLFWAYYRTLRKKEAVPV